MALSSPGIGSGIDVKGIVSQLIAIERQPVVRILERNVELKAALSGYGKLASDLSTFQSAMQDLSDVDKFSVFSTTSSNEDVVTASASGDAARGVVEVDVQRLAENHRLVAGTAFADTDTTVVAGTGETMTLTVGGSAFTVDIGDQTLAGVRDAINDASDNTGVTASIITDDTGSYLTLTSERTGADGFVTASFSGSDPLSLSALNDDRDASGTFDADDLNAVTVLEGQFTVTTSTNEVTDAITGVTLSLKDTGTSTVRIDRDTATVQKNVEAFVSAYNKVIGTLNELRDGALQTDRSTLNSLEARFRTELTQAVDSDGAYSRLFEIGITTQRDGTLAVDSSALSNVLENNFDEVATLFASENTGYAVRFERLADAYLDTGGLIDSRRQSLNRQVSDNDDRKLSLEQRIELKEQRLLEQFGGLDGVVSSLNAQADRLTQQLESIQATTLNRD